MKKPFELWAKDEITRLRTETDALERALVAYTLVAISPDAADTARVKTASGSEECGRRISIIMSAIESTPSGLAIDHLLEIVAKAGKPAERAVIRSQLWHRIKKGKLSKKGEKYLIPKAK